ncbi:MAG: exodeoxyribonuclease VII large subunit [Acidimicrobiia bacterium]
MSQPSLDLEFDDAVDPTYTVGELAVAINAALRRGFDDGVWVRGEIQGWQERGGHAYFSLADDSGETRATVNVQFFANTRARLRPLLQKHRLRLGDGMKVRIHGVPDFYAPTGRLGLKMSGIDPRYTLGEIAIARDELVRRLVAEGLYDRNRTLGLPLVPLRVGVVASVGSAAWHDFVHELELSRLGFQLSVVDVRVQGESAIPMIGGAIEVLSASAGRRALDVIVLVRGGGARADLATFDAERIARAIAGASVPVLTGLGHEVDRSVADEVANVSLKTPTACAAELIGRVDAYCRRTEQLWADIAARSLDAGAAADARLATTAHRIAVRTRGALDLATERLHRQAHRVPAAARHALVQQQGRVERAAGRVGAEARRHLRTSTLVIDNVEARVRGLDPASTLARGWSITRRADGSLVRHPDDVQPGEEIVTMVSGGDIRSRVTDASGGTT